MPQPASLSNNAYFRALRGAVPVPAAGREKLAFQMLMVLCMVVCMVTLNWLLHTPDLTPNGFSQALYEYPLTFTIAFIVRTLIANPLVEHIMHAVIPATLSGLKRTVVLTLINVGIMVTIMTFFGVIISNGAFLPPEQEALEKEYRQKLAADFDIVFDNLFVIANNPLGRFGNLLYKTGNLERYMKKLVEAFNSETVLSMMCRNQLSVGWDGVVYDCDFNQAAGLPSKSGLTIANYATNSNVSLQRNIAFGNHCYACCAGSGSS